MNNGDLKKLQFYVCPDCGNLTVSTGSGVFCCGKPLVAQTPRAAEGDEHLTAEVSDGEWYLTGRHEMRREHQVSFAALRTGDTLVLKKLYPEWGLEVRLPYLPHGTLYWYCTRHGLFYQEL